jgi:hypothetical protein
MKLSEIKEFLNNSHLQVPTVVTIFIPWVKVMTYSRSFSSPRSIWDDLLESNLSTCIPH